MSLTAEPAFVPLSYQNTADNARGAVISNGSYGEIRDVLFVENWAFWDGGAVHNYNSSPLIFRNTFWRNRCDHLGAGVHNDQPGSNPPLANNTFAENAAPIGGAIYNRHNADPIISYTIIAFSTQGEAVYRQTGATATLTCCDVYGNAGGDWVGCIAGQAGVNGNFSQDPEFCDMASGDLTLENTSPCLPENNSCGEMIGAH